MKKYSIPSFNEDTNEFEEEVLTEQQVLDYYFPHWSKEMKSVGLGALVNHEKCIEDWILTHYAIEVTE